MLLHAGASCFDIVPHVALLALGQASLELVAAGAAGAVDGDDIALSDQWQPNQTSLLPLVVRDGFPRHPSIDLLPAVLLLSCDCDLPLERQREHAVTFAVEVALAVQLLIGQLQCFHALLLALWLPLGFALV